MPVRVIRTPQNGTAPLRGDKSTVECDILVKETGRWLHTHVFRTSLKTADGARVFFHNTTDVSNERRVENESRRRIDTLNAITQISQHALRDDSIETILRTALEEILAIPWLTLKSKGAAFIVDPSNPDTLVMKASKGLSREVVDACQHVAFGKCVCGLAAASKVLQFRSSISDDHHVTYEGMAPHGHYCVPLVVNTRVVGVLNLYLRAGHQRDPHEEAFLESVAHMLAGVLERKRLDAEYVSRLRKSVEEVIVVTSRVVETRDPYTAGHQRRVAIIARAIARELSLSPEKVESIWMGGLVHDLGKISVPAEILVKPGRLSSTEFALIKQHPEVGADILKDVETPWNLSNIALSHHERLDGSGYPRGLREAKISIEARVVAVADVIEAMSSHRPYRPALGRSAALAELKAQRGTHFDARVVDAYFNIHSRLTKDPTDTASWEALEF